ncbi:hypothetical protein AAVH_24209 [Aphelenchoides avenae]|nr:hypothetical protein AAVH_24209 [Aphelenchus avenae]
MEFLHHVVETVVGSISIALNLTLLYLIGYHSNFSAPVYQVLLAVDAALDLALSTISLLAQPICFTGGGYHVLVSNGFFAGWSYGFDEFLIWMWLNFSLFNVVWIVIQFVYRYTFICLREPHRCRF